MGIRIFFEGSAPPPLHPKIIIIAKKKGIFKYTSNGMYKYVFLLLWIPGILFQSKAALLAALFQHIYIWIHYYFTELPDMKFIYGKTPLEKWG